MANTRWSGFGFAASDAVAAVVAKGTAGETIRINAAGTDLEGRQDVAATLTVTSNAATLDFSDENAYLTATVTASAALTLSNPVVGAYKRVAFTNSGGGVTAMTFAAGPTVKQSGSGTFDATDGVINEYRFECVSASGSGSYVFTISQRAA